MSWDTSGCRRLTSGMLKTRSSWRRWSLQCNGASATLTHACPCQLWVLEICKERCASYQPHLILSICGTPSINLLFVVLWWRICDSMLYPVITHRAEIIKPLGTATKWILDQLSFRFVLMIWLLFCLILRIVVWEAQRLISIRFEVSELQKKHCTMSDISHLCPHQISPLMLHSNTVSMFDSWCFIYLFFLSPSVGSAGLINRFISV